MMRSARAGTFDMLKDPIWVSNDGKVLDGHHRWAAATAPRDELPAAGLRPDGRRSVSTCRWPTCSATPTGSMTRWGVERLGVRDVTTAAGRTPGGSNFAPPAAAASGMVAAPGGVELTPEELAMGMATDIEDGSTRR